MDRSNLSNFIQFLSILFNFRIKSQMLARCITLENDLDVDVDLNVVELFLRESCNLIQQKQNKQ